MPSFIQDPGRSLEHLMFGLGQLFLLPTLLTITALFLYAFYALGAFSWQAWQRRQGDPAGFELQQLRQIAPHTSHADLEAAAVSRLEPVRIITRVMPMLGLVATMIPMGPALKALGDGQLSEVASNLMLAFSAVILALIATAITYPIAHVRRRWYAGDLRRLEQETQA